MLYSSAISSLLLGTVKDGSGTFDNWRDGQRETSFRLFGPACDFNNSLTCDIADVDMLVNKIVAGTNDLAFDLSADGTVNNADLSQWLSDLAAKNGFASPYLMGDVNLDGSVDSRDVNKLALSWRQDVASWSAGDFTADGIVDAADLNELALNWQMSISEAASQTAAIPEPSAAFLVMFVLAAMACLRRRR